LNRQDAKLAKDLGAPRPQWVRSPEELRGLASQLAGKPVLALDSEGDSLHSFPEKVCLVQVADESGEVYLVDPLSVRDLSPLAPICANPGIVKVLHGASYDLSSMKRDFHFEFANAFDTMVAGQFLGFSEVGLSALLHRFFGIAPGRSRQRDDWAKRPLSPEQEEYAAQDVRHLIPLRERMLSALRGLERERWVEEECQVLAAIPAAHRVFDPEDFLRLKGARTLDRRGLAILRELFIVREQWAREGGRPPFKVLGGECLIALAAERPKRAETLREVPGCSAKVVQRYGGGILAAIARGQAVREAELPVLPRPKKPRVPPAVQRRIEALDRWRTEAARRLGLASGLVLPRRLMERLAEGLPESRDALQAVEGLRQWRAGAFGEGILEVLAGEKDRSREAGPDDSLGDP
jgi:ribonuclease D